MNVSPNRPLYEWRAAVLSARGPESPITRLVLLVLMTWAGPDMTAFPSQAAIAKRCALSIRAVRKHLDIAEAEGWIIRGARYSRETGWRAHVYTLQIPDLHVQLAQAA